MKSIFLLLIIVSLKSSAQDTLKCRAMFSDPQSSAQNKKVSVTVFYVILKDGKPVKFLMADRKRETHMEIWDYRLEGEPRWPKKKSDE